MPLAFPMLADPERTKHVFEIGCGAGSALLPVLRCNSSAVVSGSDVSPRAVSAFLEAAGSSGLDAFPVPEGGGKAGTTRVAGAFALDATSGNAPALVSEKLANSPPVDAVLLVFTLGALDREGHVEALKTAAAALRAGRERGRRRNESGSAGGGGGVVGVGDAGARPPPPPPSASTSSPSSPRVLVRDHGLFDVAHMRAPRRVSGNLHSRSDGTLCYFFSPGDLAGAAERAGLRRVEARWATVERRNRKSGQVLRRVFVHGEFELDE